MNKTLAMGIGGLLILLLLIFSMTFTVKYNEVAIKRTFGRADEKSVIRDAGLHFRWPVFIDKVEKLDRRLQLVESPLEEIATADGLQVTVRGFLLWQVDTEGNGPREFFDRYGGIEEASRSLKSQFRTALTGVLSEYDFTDLIGERSRLDEAEAAVRSTLAASLADAGVEPQVVGVSQLMLPSNLTDAVIRRMEATRKTLAEGQRRLGESEAQAIQADGNTKADKIRSFASLLAEEIRAESEADAARFYEQMSQDEELAMFLVWLDAFELTLGQNTTAFLPTSIAPMHLANPREAVMKNGIPFPSSEPPAASAEVDDEATRAADDVDGEKGS